MGPGHGKKKTWADRARTASRVRTGKKGRSKPRSKPTPNLSATSRSKETTGRLDIVFDAEGKPTKVFTPVS